MNVGGLSGVSSVERSLVPAAIASRGSGRGANGEPVTLRSDTANATPVPRLCPGLCLDLCLKLCPETVRSEPIRTYANNLCT